jgi:hypothetical protein
MTKFKDGIREVSWDKDKKRARLVFGPHYYVNLTEDKDGKVKFELGATHHGFEADASEVGKGLEDIINFIRKEFSNQRTD